MVKFFRDETKFLRLMLNLVVMKKKNDCHYKFKIGSNVRKWRIIQGLKQKDMAFKLNLSEAAVSNIENDISVPTLDHVEDIAEALGISISILLLDPQQIITANTKNNLSQYI